MAGLLPNGTMRALLGVSADAEPALTERFGASGISGGTRYFMTGKTTDPRTPADQVPSSQLRMLRRPGLGAAGRDAGFDDME
jgi:hypothetical protein